MDSSERHVATAHASFNPTQILELTTEDMKEGADAITLIGRSVSATAIEDRVKHGRIHLCIMKELPRALGREVSK